MANYSTPKIDFSKPLDLSTVKGRTVVITGGASGMGLGVARVLAENGAHVALLDLNEESGRKVEREMKDKGQNVVFIQTDVTSWESQSDAFKAALTFSPNESIDIIILSAGLGGEDILKTAIPDDLAAGSDLPKPSTKVLDVNSTGVFFSTNLALHYFHNHPGKDVQHKKHLVFIASLAGYGAIPLLSTYIMSKFAVRGLWKTLVSEGHRFGPPGVGVRFNLVAPTYVRSPMTDFFIDQIEAQGNIIAEIPDAVAGIVRLVCDESIQSRAISICGRKDKNQAPGSTNFDLCDDLEGSLSGRELNRHLEDGTYGKAFFNIFDQKPNAQAFNDIFEQKQNAQ